jgi:NTE family protein
MPAPEKRNVAIACQGGGSHAAFAAGVLLELLQPARAALFDLVGLSGTSGGAVCAALAWSGLIRKGGGPTQAAEALAAFWEELAADGPVDAALNFWTLVWARLPVTFEMSPYTLQNPAEPELRRLLEKHVRLEGLSPEERACLPKLFVGATDIRNGHGEAFPGETLTYDDIVASAAVPPIYRAVHTRNTLYWDGLFSRNPPVREFTELEPKERKPDEIWIIRINPRASAGEPILISDIVDRRNELSGNVSLDQELFFIEKINALRAQFPALQERYKHIALREVELSLDLDYPSKLDRAPSHIHRLLEEGRAAAPLLLTGAPGERRGSARLTRATSRAA